MNAISYTFVLNLYIIFMQQDRQIQFEVWKECNTNCKFCYLADEKLPISTEEKILNLNKIYNILKNKNIYKEYNIISFIGGEFFQGQLSDDKVKNLFFEIIAYINNLLENNIIKEFWICATLIIGDHKDLFEMLKLISDKSKIWICTSYDPAGRFHTVKMYENWKNIILKLRNLYPEIKINVTSILTGIFIDKYLNNDLELVRFSKDNNLILFLKPPCPIGQCLNDKKSKDKEEVNKIIPNFFPTRQKFLDFLFKYKTTEDDFFYDKLFNMKYRCNTLYHLNNGEVNEISIRVKEKHQEYDNIVNNDVNNCGHSIQYKIYIDTDDCCICDKELIKNI